jgi:hypothetical protein
MKDVFAFLSRSLLIVLQNLQKGIIGPISCNTTIQSKFKNAKFDGFFTISLEN